MTDEKPKPLTDADLDLDTSDWQVPPMPIAIVKQELAKIHIERDVAIAHAEAAEDELAAVREAWEKERAAYDETTRVLNEARAGLIARAEAAEAERDEAREEARLAREQRDVIDGRLTEIRARLAAIEAKS